MKKLGLLKNRISLLNNTVIIDEFTLIDDEDKISQEKKFQDIALKNPTFSLLFAKETIGVIDEDGDSIKAYIKNFDTIECFEFFKTSSEINYRVSNQFCALEKKSDEYKEIYLFRYNIIGYINLYSIIKTDLTIPRAEVKISGVCNLGYYNPTVADKKNLPRNEIQDTILKNEKKDFSNVGILLDNTSEPLGMLNIYGDTFHMVVFVADGLSIEIIKNIETNEIPTFKIAKEDKVLNEEETEKLNKIVLELQKILESARNIYI